MSSAVSRFLVRLKQDPRGATRSIRSHMRNLRPAVLDGFFQAGGSLLSSLLPVAVAAQIASTESCPPHTEVRVIHGAVQVIVSGECDGRHHRTEEEVILDLADASGAVEAQASRSPAEPGRQWSVDGARRQRLAKMADRAPMAGNTSA